jgi:hypothetical protein
MMWFCDEYSECKVFVIGVMDVLLYFKTWIHSMQVYGIIIIIIKPLLHSFIHSAVNPMNVSSTNPDASILASG